MSLEVANDELRLSDMPYLLQMLGYMEMLQDSVKHDFFIVQKLSEKFFIQFLQLKYSHQEIRDAKKKD